MIVVDLSGVDYYENFDLEHIVTPVNADTFEQLLRSANYPLEKLQFISDGFRFGFDLGYRGLEEVRLRSRNLPLTVGSQTELWNKVMSEVKVGRYAGPFTDIPFNFYIQSPIGLVPKDQGKKTCLIFHLSHPKGGTTSVNANTPESMTSVDYPKFDEAIELCLKAGKGCAIAKSDLISAFRILGLQPKFWKYLVLKAQCPIDQHVYYFIDKCMPFGASISCAAFQKVSDAISHLVTYRTGRKNVNYLDDYFFVALLKLICNNQVKSFMQVCAEIGFPVSLDKTYWATNIMTFLGLLIDTNRQLILIPLEKLDKAKALVNKIRNSKRITLGQLQQLCGVLNFLCKCIVPGRAFTRRLYAAGAGLTNEYHHLPVTKEMKSDLQVWAGFLDQPDGFCRPFVDFDRLDPEVTDFYTDASGNPDLGAGGHCGSSWFILQWDHDYFAEFDPSIDYLELYALTIGIKLWLHRFRNKRITVFCDNLGVVHMINSNTSSSKACMVLIREIVLHSIVCNARVFAAHVPTRANVYADLLSRLKYRQFREVSRRRKDYFRGRPDTIPVCLWPMEKVLPVF